MIDDHRQDRGVVLPHRRGQGGVDRGVLQRRQGPGQHGLRQRSDQVSAAGGDRGGPLGIGHATGPVALIEGIEPTRQAVAQGDGAAAICSTGLPGIYDLSPRARRAAIAGYVTRIIDRDVPEQGGSVRRPDTLRSWLTAYAAASSTTTTYTKILDAATPADTDKISKKTSDKYRDLLTKIWVLDSVPAWSPQAPSLARLNLSPKHQLFDPGIAANLLGITDRTLVSAVKGTGEIFGQLFESLATLCVRTAGQAAEARTFHLRTKAGEHEVDLILERYDGAVLAFEVKLSPTVDDKDVSHLHWLGEQIGDSLVDKIVLTTGSTAYRRADGVAVVPLALLG